AAYDADGCDAAGGDQICAACAQTVRVVFMVVRNEHARRGRGKLQCCLPWIRLYRYYGDDGCRWIGEYWNRLCKRVSVEASRIRGTTFGGAGNRAGASRRYQGREGGLSASYSFLRKRFHCRVL